MTESSIERCLGCDSCLGGSGINVPNPRAGRLPDFPLRGNLRCLRLSDCFMSFLTHRLCVRHRRTLNLPKRRHAPHPAAQWATLKTSLPKLCPPKPRSNASPHVFEWQGISTTVERWPLDEVPISTSCARLGLNGLQTRYLDDRGNPVPRLRIADAVGSDQDSSFPDAGLAELRSNPRR